jgi:hypothetical protein
MLLRRSTDTVTIERENKLERIVLVVGSEAWVRYFRVHMHNNLRPSIETYDNARLLIMFPRPHCCLEILCKSPWMSLTPHADKHGKQFKNLPKLTLLEQKTLRSVGCKGKLWLCKNMEKNRSWSILKYYPSTQNPLKVLPEGTSSNKNIW